MAINFEQMSDEELDAYLAQQGDAPVAPPVPTTAPAVSGEQQEEQEATPVDPEQMTDAQLDALLLEQQDILQQETSFDQMSEEELDTYLAENEPEEKEEDPLADRSFDVPDTEGDFVGKPSDVPPVKEGADFWEDVSDVSKDIAIQTVAGINAGGQEIMNTVTGFLVNERPFKDRNIFGDAETTAGGIAESVARFGTGFAVAPVKALGFSVQGSRALNTLVQGSARGFVGDYAVTNAQDKTTANLMKELGADNFIVNALAVNEDDSLHTVKFKSGLDGIILGFGIGSIFEYGLKPAAKIVGDKVTDTKIGIDMLTESKKARLDRETEDLFQIADTDFPQHVPVVSADGTITLAAKSPSSGQQVMDDIQALQIQDTVDRKMVILKERRAKFEEDQAVMDPLKTGESLKTRKQAKQNIFVIEKDIERLDKDIIKAEEALEEATKRLDNTPIPKSVIDEDLAEQAVPGPAGQVTEGGSIYRELATNQKNILESLDNLQKNKLQAMEDITGQKFILRELTDDAQAAKALRNKEALRLRGPLPPQYEEIVLEDLIPLAAGKAAGKVDASKKAQVPRPISQPVQRLNPDAAENMLPTNEWDALGHNLFHLPRPIERVWAKVNELGSSVIFRSADSMKSLGTVSRTAAHLSNMLRHDTSRKAKKAGNYGYTESVQFLSGKYKADMSDTIQKFLKDEDLTRWGNLTPAANKSIARILRGIDVENAPAHHRRAAERLREILNDFHGEAKTDVPTGFIENFFPRKWKAGNMHKQADKVRAKLKAAGHSDERVDEIVRKLVNEMNEDLGAVRALRGEDDFSFRGSKFLSSGSRSVEIDELDFEEFLDDDILNVLNNYFENGSRKITYNDMFGYDGGKVHKMVEAITIEAREGGRPILPQETKALKNLLSNVQGMQKFGNAWDGVNTAVGTTMRVMHLGMAVLASFGEPFIPFGKAGFLQATKGMTKAATSIPKHWASKVLKGVPEAEAYAAAQRVNLALDAAAAERLSSLLGGEVLTGFAKKLNNAFFKATLLTEWVKMVQVAAFHTGRSVITDNLTVLAKGDVSGIVSSGAMREKKLRNELESLGVDVEAGIRWVKGGKNIDHPFMEMMDRGSLRFANDSALHPDAAVRPSIQNRPEALLLTQFKAYPTAFSNVVLRDWGTGLTQGSPLEIGTKAARVSVATALILGATGYGVDLRELIQYHGENPHKVGQTSQERLIDNMDVSGILGRAAIVKHAFDADRYNQDPMFAWAGPAIGKGKELISGLVELATDDTGKGQKTLGKLASRSLTNALPVEIMMSFASNDGSQAVRENLRTSLDGTTPREQRKKERQQARDKRKAMRNRGNDMGLGIDIDIFNAVAALYPTEFMSLFDDDDPTAHTIEDSEVNTPDESWLNENSPQQKPSKDTKAFKAADIFGDTGKTAAEFWAKSYNAEHSQFKDPKKRAEVLAEKTQAFEDAQKIEVLPEVKVAIADIVDSGVFALEFEKRNMDLEGTKVALENISKIETAGGRNNEISSGAAGGILQVIPSTFKGLVSDTQLIGDRALSFLGKDREFLTGLSNKEIGEYLRDDNRAGALFGTAAFIDISKNAQINFGEVSPLEPIDQMEQLLRRRDGQPEEVTN